MLASPTSKLNSNPLLNTAADDDFESKSKQHVTYPDRTTQMEMVYTTQMEMVYKSNELEIYYWQSHVDGKWYFEDPLNDDAIICAGSHEKLMKKLSRRQFWWLETNEDVVVKRHHDGSKAYSYQGLSDPKAITELLDAESKQIEEKPVSKLKAGVLAAMSLLGNSTGFQSLVKNQVSAAESESFEPHSTTLKALRLLNNPAPVSSQTTANPNDFAQNSFFDANYYANLSLRGLQMASIVLGSAAAAVSPRIGRRQGVAPLSLMAMLMNTTSVSRCSGCASAVVTPQRRSL